MRLIFAREYDIMKRYIWDTEGRFGMANIKKRRRISAISALHYFKLCYRSALLILAAVVYLMLVSRGEVDLQAQLHRFPVILGLIWVLYVGEMILRFFPSKLESMGCQKQFRKNYIPTDSGQRPTRRHRGVWLVTLSWLALNGVIGLLYYTGIIDSGILLLISLTYAVCDMICILFFCPFQTWMMKNKCCGSCRIYNWDYAMMFTPLVFIPHYYTWSLLGIALLLLAVWEITAHLHPERFSEHCNQSLHCGNCREKLCHHKTQLRHFLRTNKEALLLKGNALLDKAKRKGGG
jgi:hypothetical protein